MRVIKAQVVPLGKPLSAKATVGAVSRCSDCAANFLDRDWSAEDVFWSRYFWICTYPDFVQSTTSSQVRLEQFMFKLLEQLSPDCESDWPWVERLVELSRQRTKHSS